MCIFTIIQRIHWAINPEELLYIITSKGAHCTKSNEVSSSGVVYQPCKRQNNFQEPSTSVKKKDSERWHQLLLQNIQASKITGIKTESNNYNLSGSPEHLDDCIYYFLIPEKHHFSVETFRCQVDLNIKWLFCCNSVKHVFLSD